MPFFSVQFKYSVQPGIVIKLCFLIPFSIDLYYISCFPRSKFCMVFAFPYFRFTLPQAPENSNFFFFPRTNYQNNTSAPMGDYRYGYKLCRVLLDCLEKWSKPVYRFEVYIYIYIYTCDMLSFSRGGKVN